MQLMPWRDVSISRWVLLATSQDAIRLKNRGSKTRLMTWRVLSIRCSPLHTIPFD